MKGEGTRGGLNITYPTELIILIEWQPMSPIQILSNASTARPQGCICAASPKSCLQPGVLPNSVKMKTSLYHPISSSFYTALEKIPSKSAEILVNPVNTIRCTLSCCCTCCACPFASPARIRLEFKADVAATAAAVAP